MNRLTIDLFKKIVDHFYGDKVAAHSWLVTPHRALKGRTPQEALNQENGHDVVEIVLKYHGPIRSPK